MATPFYSNTRQLSPKQQTVGHFVPHFMEGKCNGSFKLSNLRGHQDLVIFTTLTAADICVSDAKTM